MSIFTVPSLGGGSPGPPGPPGPPGSSDPRFFLRYSFGPTGVPASGTRFLNLGPGVFSSEVGDLLTADGAVRGISVSVNAADGFRDYQVQVLTDPSGSAVLAATLDLPAGSPQERRRDLNVPIVGLLDLGVALVLTAGVGASTFDEIVVLVEVSIP